MKTKRVMRTFQREMHLSGRAGWLRAAVLGADDAIVSTSSLMIGVAASAASQGAILIAGVAGLVAGTISANHRVDDEDTHGATSQTDRMPREVCLGLPRRSSPRHAANEDWCA